MTVSLTFQSSGTVPPNAGPVRMVGGSLTLGRSEQNDIVLPDPDRTISGQHCVIEDHRGNIVVVDLSTNGTFLNYGKIPLGRTPTPLNDGDILCVGGYEILVSIKAQVADTLADPAPAPAPSAPRTDMGGFLDPLGEDGGDGDFLDDLLGSAATGPAGLKSPDPADDPLGDEFLPPLPDPAPVAQSDHGSALNDTMQMPAATPGPAPTPIPDDWDLDLDIPEMPEATLDLPEPEPVPTTAPPPAPPLVEPEPAAVRTAPPSPRPAAGTGQDAARAFLQALGAGDLDISDDDLPDTMRRLGGVMNKMVAGIREILMTRQSIKSEFRIHQTTISAGGNNPLKFSVSVEQSVAALTLPAVKGYLPADQAVTEALDDIKAHEVATITGMEAALKGVLARLEPARLAERIAADKSLRSVLTNKKARYWDVFEAQYQEISDQAENDFHDLFSREFGRAYQAQLERLKKK